jgi:hypothetical protein
MAVWLVNPRTTMTEGTLVGEAAASRDPSVRPTGQRKNPMACKSTIALIPQHSLPNGSRLSAHVRGPKTRSILININILLTAISRLRTASASNSCCLISTTKSEAGSMRLRLSTSATYSIFSISFNDGDDTAVCFNQLLMLPKGAIRYKCDRNMVSFRWPL